MARTKKAKKQPSLATISTRLLRDVPTATLSNDNLGPTPERLAQAGLAVASDRRSGRLQVVGAGSVGIIGADRVVRLTDAPLDRLHARRRLDEADADRNRILFEAGERLRIHHFQAGLSGLASASNFNGAGGGGGLRTPITETQERHRREMRRAEAGMDAGDWAAVRAVVLEERILEEVGREIGYQQASAAAGVALDRLRRGLKVLAQLWGALPPDRPALIARPVALAA
ncbi:hypothetical protein [Methylobacterium sp. Gmos1]